MSGRGGRRGHTDFYRGAPPSRGGMGGGGMGGGGMGGGGMGGGGMGGGGMGGGGMGGDYYGGPGYGYGGPAPGYPDHRDSRPPPPGPAGGRGRYIEDRGPPPRTAGRRRPVPPGVIVFRSLEEERDFVEDRRRRRISRPTKFDLMHSATHTGSQEGFDPSTIMNNSNASSWSTNNKSFPQMNNFSPQEMGMASSDNGAVPQQTRHARRLYVGNLPQFITEDQIHRVFRDAIRQALVTPPPGEKLSFNIDEDPILSVYINHERRFCFLEFKSVELCSACMALDGLEVVPGQPPVKVKRPNDYNASLAPKLSSLPELDVSRLGIISPTVLDGPNKIFIGGLHYHMTEGQVLELLQAFGKVKAFHLVKNDPDASTSKGYCFVEYSDSSLTSTVVASLNGMDIGGGKSLTARLAGERHGTVAPLLMPTGASVASVPPIVQAQHMQHQALISGMGSNSLAPDRNIVNGYDVEALVDAALGKCPMPTGPSHFDSFGQPLTRIVPVIPQPTIPALTPQQQLAINALPSMNSIQPMNPIPSFHTIQSGNGMGGFGGMNEMQGLGNMQSYNEMQSVNMMQQPIHHMQQQVGEMSEMNGMASFQGMQSSNGMSTMNSVNMLPPNVSTIPALTPQQQAAINALSLLPVGGVLAPTQQVETPTCILVLLNMVTDQDLETEDDYTALVEEIKEECAKFGLLKSIVVPKNIDSMVEPSAIRKVFLEYASAEDAMKADAELSGRQFGVNVVKTQYFSEKEFADGYLR